MRKVVPLVWGSLRLAPILWLKRIVPEKEEKDQAEWRVTETDTVSVMHMYPIKLCVSLTPSSLSLSLSLSHTHTHTHTHQECSCTHTDLCVHEKHVNLKLLGQLRHSVYLLATYGLSQRCYVLQELTLFMNT